MASAVKTKTLHPGHSAQTFIRSLEKQINRHWGDIRYRGEPYVARVGEFDLNEDLRRLFCQVPGSQRSPYQVDIQLNSNFDRVEHLAEQVMDVSCTCVYSGGSAYCKHTYAALRALRLRLADPNHATFKLLFAPELQEPGGKLIALLDRFIAEVNQVSAPAEAPPASRIVWRVNFLSETESAHPTGTVEVEPFEQRRRKATGKWSSGRRVTWDRLFHSRDLLNHPADAKILAMINKQRARPMYGWYSASYAQPDLLPLLTALVGHPNVVLGDSGEPLEVVRGEAGLAVMDLGKRKWGVVTAIDGEVVPNMLLVNEGEEDQNGLVAVDVDSRRVLVAPLRQQLLGLIKGLLTRHSVFPHEAREPVFAKLTQLQKCVPVAWPEELCGGTEHGDARIFLRLTPLLPGLTVEMFVRPSGELDFAPGQGPRRVSLLRDGKQLSVERDAPAETARAKAIATELGLDRFEEDRAWRWQLTTSDDALDLVASLSDRAGEDLVVEWPEGARITLSRELQPTALRVEIDESKDWFGLSGTVEVDGEQVALKEVLAGLRGGKKYVAIGPNKWIRIAHLFRHQLETLDDVVHETRSGLEIDLSAAPVVEELLGEHATLKACAAWKKTITRLKHAEEISPEPPATLTAELRDYQLDGYRWLSRLAAWGVGACLADDMGLGKTVQTLAALIDRAPQGPALVVAPTSVGFNWVREAQRFAPTLRTILYRETDREEVLDSLVAGDLLVVSYGLLLRDAEKLQKVNWGTLVLDEAQKIKNSVTKTAQAVRQISADWRLALTGTPLENHLGELWSIFRAVCPGLLGSWDRFREKFAERIERQKDSGRRKALARVMRPFILRRTKSEVLEELPERTEIIRTAELSGAERERYQASRLEAVARLAGVVQGQTEDRRFEVLAALTRLRQLACHPRLVDASWSGTSAKLDLLLEIVEELREGRHRALVFSQFTQHLGLIREALDAREISYLYLDGQTPAKEREKRVDAFQRGEGDLFLISLKAGGTGLNLTAADYVIHMDPWWNPAVEDQATDRAHRIGQTRPVTVYRIVAKDTIEEQILSLHAEKRHLVSDVLEGTDQAGRLSSRELVSLIRGDSEGDEADETSPARRRAR